jgi:hypothetical protein
MCGHPISAKKEDKMRTREEMRSLAGEIVSSYTDRIATIADIRSTIKLDLLESRRHMEELRELRVAMGREIRDDLTRNVNDRKREMANILKGFSMELKELSKAHSIMSKQLKDNLARGVTELKHEVGAMMNDFGQAHDAMSKQMRYDLARGADNRKRGVGNMLKGFSAELKEVRSDLTGARDEWQILTNTLHERRVGAAVQVKPVEAVEEVAEEVSKITPEIDDLSDKVFEYMANHPNGTKMNELEKEFGVARIQMAKVVRSLIDENKAKKQGLHYFAI